MSEIKVDRVATGRGKIVLFDFEPHEDIHSRFAMFKIILEALAERGQKCLLLFDREGYRRYGGDIISFFRKNMPYVLSVREGDEEVAKRIFEENDDIRTVLTVGSSVIGAAKAFCTEHGLPLFSLLTIPDSDKIFTGTTIPESIFVDLSLSLSERDLKRAYGFLGKAVLAAFEFPTARSKLNAIIKDYLFMEFDGGSKPYLMLAELSAAYGEHGIFTAADSMLDVLSGFTRDVADYAFTVSSLVTSIYRQVLTSKTQIALPVNGYKQFLRLNKYGFKGNECLKEKPEADFTLPDATAELTKACQILNLIAPNALNLPLPLDEIQIKDCLFLSCTLYPTNGLMNSLYLNGFIA